VKPKFIMLDIQQVNSIIPPTMMISDDGVLPGISILSDDTYFQNNVRINGQNPVVVSVK